MRLRTRVGTRYLLRSDIANFYGSIYTHSVPWALHTKAVAKLNRGPDLVGNRLDRLLRNAQDGQTIGISIGPDSSLLIAECLLRPLDDALRRELGVVRGFRYVDDYELGFRSLAEAERALGTIERTLADFELSPSASKTSLAEAPLSIGTQWANDLRVARGTRARARMNAGAVGRYADLALRAGAAAPGEPVMRFAIASLRGVEPSSGEAWQMLQAFLLNAIASDATCLPHVIDLLERHRTAGRNANPRRWEEAFGAVIAHHAPLRHSDEVAWALWGILTLGLRLVVPQQAVVSLSQMESDVVALLALDYNTANQGAIPVAAWAQWMTTGQLQEEHWLVAYEANVKGWLPSLGCADNVLAHPCFATLKHANVQFYDRPAPGTLAAAAQPIPGGGIGEFYA